MVALNACLNSDSTRFIKYVRALGQFLISFQCGMYICDECFAFTQCILMCTSTCWANAKKRERAKKRGRACLVFLLCVNTLRSKDCFFALYSLQFVISFCHGDFLLFPFSHFTGANKNWLRTYIGKKKFNAQVKNYLPISCIHVFENKKKEKITEKSCDAYQCHACRYQRTLNGLKVEHKRQNAAGINSKN